MASNRGKRRGNKNPVSSRMKLMKELELREEEKKKVKHSSEMKDSISELFKIR